MAKRTKRTNIEQIEKEMVDNDKAWNEIRDTLRNIITLEKEQIEINKNPPTPYDVIHYMINTWGDELAAQREELQTNLNAILAISHKDASIITLKNRIKAVDKDIAALAILRVIIPQVVTLKKVEKKISTWIELIQALGCSIGENILQKKNNLDIRQSISAAFDNRDIIVFCSSVKAFIKVQKATHNDTKAKMLSREHFLDLMKQLDSEGYI